MSKNYNTRTFPKNNRSYNTPNYRFIASSEDPYTFYYKRMKSGENPAIGQRIYLQSGNAYWITSVSHRPSGTYKGSKNCGVVTVRKCTN